jgi:hypothetical protein
MMLSEGTIGVDNVIVLKSGKYSGREALGREPS